MSSPTWKCGNCNHGRFEHHINLESCDLAIFVRDEMSGDFVAKKCDCIGWVGIMLEDDLGPRAA